MGILFTTKSNIHAEWCVAVSSDSANPGGVDQPLQSIRFVGPSTAAILDREGYDATAITDKRLSYRMLVEAGVNPGVAAKIRREHSLSWSFRSGGDLDRRSAQVRGLGRAEAAWVAASAGDWASGDSHSTDIADESVETGEPTPWPTHGDAPGETSATDPVDAEAAWRVQSKPTPLEELDGLDTEAVALLAEAGIISVRRLASIDTNQIADVLGVSEHDVRAWHDIARAAAD